MSVEAIERVGRCRCLVCVWDIRRSGRPLAVAWFVVRYPYTARQLRSCTMVFEVCFAGSPGAISRRTVSLARRGASDACRRTFSKRRRLPMTV